MHEVSDEAGRSLLAAEFLLALALCAVRFGGLPMPGGRALIALIGSVLMTIVFFSLLWQHFRAPLGMRRAQSRTQIILGLFWPVFLALPLVRAWLPGMPGRVAGGGMAVCMVALVLVAVFYDGMFRARWQGHSPWQGHSRRPGHR